MMIKVEVTAGKRLYGEDVVRKEIRLETENAAPADLPWEAICAGLVQAALVEPHGMNRD